MARPTKFTPETQSAIIAAIRDGVPRKHAAQAAGVSVSTLFSWCAQGRRGKKPYVEFLDGIKRAESEAVAERVRVIKSAMPKSWQAAAWWLERQHPDEFATDAREIRQIRKELDELKRQRTTKR